MPKFPEDFVPVTGYVEDPKVYTCVCKGVNKTPAVTHADYRALEELAHSYRTMLCQSQDDVQKLEEELAALRGKTEALANAANGMLDVTGRGSVCTVTKSLEAYRLLESCLEALK